MSDNIYRVLMGDNAPFLGMANTSYMDRVLRGVIVKTYYDVMSESSVSTQPIFNQQSYRTVDVEMMEGKPYTFEKVHIPELVSFKGYGLNYLPSVGDIVLVAFDSNNSPVIVNIVARCSAYEHGALDDGTMLPVLNNYGDVTIDKAITKSIRPTPIRYIKEGEISLTSLNGNSELYFDQYGTSKLISRVPNLNKECGEQCGDRLWEICTGQQIVDETTGFVRQSTTGNNIEYQIYGHKSGLIINADDKGNLEIINRGSIITINEKGEINIATGKSGRTPYILGNHKNKFKVPTIKVENGQIRLMLSSDGKSYDLYDSLLPIEIKPNAEVSFHITYDEEDKDEKYYKIYVPDKKEPICIKNKAKLFNDDYWWLLNNSSNYECYNAGSINLSDIKLNIDGVNVFDGSSAVESIDYINNGCKESSKVFSGGIYKYILIKKIFDFSTAKTWRLDINYTQLDGESINIDKNTITLGNGNTQQAVLGNNLENLLLKLISAFNSHTHTGNLGYPTTPPNTMVEMEDILSKTVEVK